MRLASTKLNFQLSHFTRYDIHSSLYFPSLYKPARILVFAVSVCVCHFRQNIVDQIFRQLDFIVKQDVLNLKFKKDVCKNITHSECTILFCFHKRKQNITKLFLCSQNCIRYTCVQTQFQSSVNNIRYPRYWNVWPKKNFIFSRGVKTFKPIWTFLLQNIVD